MYERFEQLLKEKNVTVADVARATGIGKSTFSGWKNGKYVPKQDKRMLIASYFGVSLDYLDGRTSDRRSKAEIVKDCIKETERKAEPIFEVACGEGRVNGDYAVEYVNEEEDLEGYSWCKVVGDSMYPELRDGDMVKIKHQTSTKPTDLTVVKVDGESATIKYVEIVENGVWLRAINKSVFSDTFYTVAEVMSLPITIVGKVVQMQRNI